MIRRPVDPVDPPTLTFPVRDRVVTLTAMSDERLLDWGEMHILLAQELLAAYALARNTKEVDSPAYRAILAQMIEAEMTRVCMATGFPPDFVSTLSVPERQEIIKRQNDLNGINSHLEAFQVGQLKGAYAEQSP